MSPVVRFAPSPTGRIHLGNARTALLNWLYARAHGGRFILRYDDTDRERSTQEYADSIAVDLDWLGLHPDAVYRQSERGALYDVAIARLKQAGRLYPAYETAEELERKRKRLQGRGLPPIYDRAALKLTDEDRATLEAQGKCPHWRFKLDSVRVEWDDLVRGPSHIDCASLSDPVLIREDGACLYTLTSVVDDLDLKITHIVRGEDHVTNTAVQIQIFRALGGEPPVFGHHNLLTDASGEGLSKRSGALSLTGLREAGIEPLAVAALATLTGTSEAVRPIASLDELASLVKFDHISRSASKFDPSELGALSARTLHAMPFAAARARLAAAGVEGDSAEAFWEMARGNLDRFDDVAIWRQVVYGPVAPVIEDAPFLEKARALLPPAPWDRATWSAWTAAIRQATGRKGKALFHPLRLALTGRESGPELAQLLPLIGPATASARLSGSAA